MGEEEGYEVEFEERPGRWVPVAGAIYKDKGKQRKEGNERLKRWVSRPGLSLENQSGKNGTSES